MNTKTYDAMEQALQNVAQNLTREELQTLQAGLAVLVPALGVHKCQCRTYGLDEQPVGSAERAMWRKIISDVADLERLMSGALTEVTDNLS